MHIGKDKIPSAYYKSQTHMSDLYNLTNIIMTISYVNACIYIHKRGEIAEVKLLPWDISKSNRAVKYKKEILKMMITIRIIIIKQDSKLQFPLNSHEYDSSSLIDIYYYPS